MPSPHVIESPVQTPTTHASAMVQVIASLHGVPSGSNASGGQLGPDPLQLSATSH